MCQETTTFCQLHTEQGTLGSSYLPDNLGWLCVVNGFEKLLHGCVEITLLIKIIAIFPKNYVSLHSIKIGLLG